MTQIHWRKAPKFVIPRSEATWESPAAGYVFAEAYLLFNMVLRDCHVGLRPPRNDTSGSAEVHQSTSAVKFSPYRALAERRYRRNWFVRFIVLCTN